MKNVSPAHAWKTAHAWKNPYSRPSVLEHHGNPAGPASVSRLRKDAVSLPITTSVDTCSCDGGCGSYFFC